MTAMLTLGLDALGRIEDLVGEVSAKVSHRAIASAIDLVVFMCRTAKGREVREIIEVEGYKGGEYVFRVLGEGKKLPRGHA